MLPTQPLRDEHRELLPQIEELRVVADMIGEAPPKVIRTDLDRSYSFLTHHLIPHAQAEDAALYPVVERAMAAPGATATMRRDHTEVLALVSDLHSVKSQLNSEEISLEQAKALRRILYGLYALVKVHFAKEEEIYLPLMDAKLTPEQARSMFEAMERAATKAKALSSV